MRVDWSDGCVSVSYCGRGPINKSLHGIINCNYSPEDSNLGPILRNPLINCTQRNTVLIERISVSRFSFIASPADIIHELDRVQLRVHRIVHHGRRDVDRQQSQEFRQIN